MILGKRILVVGANGSGKTVFAKKLSVKLSIPFYELDSISWLNDWKEMPSDEFSKNVTEITKLKEWIIDGNYKHTMDLRLERAETAIWLDYPVFKVFYRVSKRTLHAFITQRYLWKNNRQSFRKTFYPKESILLYSLKTFGRKKRLLSQKMNTNRHNKLNWIRITSQKEEHGFWERVSKG